MPTSQAGLSRPLGFVCLAGAVVVCCGLWLSVTVRVSQDLGFLICQMKGSPVSLKSMMVMTCACAQRRLSGIS